MSIPLDRCDVKLEYFRPQGSDAGMIDAPQEKNDHILLREMLNDVLPGLEGEVLSGNCERAEGEGDPEQINTSCRLYALWER